MQHIFSFLLPSIIGMVCLVNVQLAWSLPHSQMATLYEHLYEVNQQWLWAAHDLDPVVLSQKMAFTSDLDRIQAHLLLVESLLQKRTRIKPLAAIELEKRASSLAILHKYAQSGVFPKNTYHATRTPYFIDDFGTPCAVGHLLIESGHTDFAQRVRRDNNYAYIRDLLVYPELSTWAAQNGFEVRELALIQPTYAPITGYLWHGVPEGTDGTVFALATNLPNKQVIIGGDFTYAGGVECHNIAKWNGNSFEPLGNGLTGAVKCIAFFNNQIYVGGLFQIANASYNLARWNGTSWVYSNVSIGTEVLALLVRNSAVYAAGNFGLCRLQNGVWADLGYFNAPVRCLNWHNGMLVVGGDFTQINNAAANHIATWNGQVWQNLDINLQWTVPVRALAANDGVLYAGGDFFATSDNSPALGFARQIANTNHWQSLINVLDYASWNGHTCINTMTVANGSVFVGGDFEQFFGNDLAKYTPTTNTFELLATFYDALPDEPAQVFVLALKEDKLWTGGNLPYVDASGIESGISNNLMYADVFAVQSRLSLFLQGAYNGGTGLMNTQLRSANLIPTQQPFGGMPWNYNGTEIIALSDMPDNVVDWVLVEVRNPDNSSEILDTRAALLLDDGSVMDVTGDKAVNFYNLNDRKAQYLLSVKHRNHLGLVANFPQILAQQTFHFNYPDWVKGGIGQLAPLPAGNYGLPSGDIDGNGIITVADFNRYQTQASQLNAYLSSDCDLNRSVTVSDYNRYQSNASRMSVGELRY